MRLIDADRLLRRLGMARKCEDCPNQSPIKGLCGLSVELMEVCDEIEKAPSADITLGATCEIGNYEIEQYPDYMDFVRNEIARHLSKEVLEYAEITEDKDVMREMTVVRALMRVVKRENR